MAQTQIINSISRTDTFPVEVAISASNNCGMLLLSLNGDWSDQMVYELPALNVTIYLDDTTILKSFNINMRTVFADCKPTEPYCIPIYDIPEQCIVKVLPIFDNNALTAHNEMLADGIVSSIETTDGIVGSDVVQKWNTVTSTFNLSLIFDDSNIQSGGGSGGEPQITIDTQVQEGSPNPVQNGAIYNFVNSSVATNTANFVGTYNSLEELEEHQGYPYDITNNDYGFVIATDAQGNTTYNRYKYNAESSEWQFEYTLNNSSFTAAQWATIQSGFTASDKTKLNGIENGATRTIVDTQFDNTSNNPVTNSLLTRTMTPMTQAEYDALTNKDLPLYFIYEE